MGGLPKNNGWEIDTISQLDPIGVFVFKKGQGIKYKIKIGSNIRSHNFWGRGGACVSVPWKENTRTSRHVKRYGDRDGDGVGRGMCYRSMEGEHKDKQT